MTPPRIRLAAEDDAEAIRSIYAPFVRDSAISFETLPPDREEILSRILETLPALPWLVCGEPGAVLGYAYAGRFGKRPAYDWSVEVSAYVAAAAHRKGVGRRLYAALLDLLTRQGFAYAYAGITLPNEASVGLHEAMGFEVAGVFRRVGFKQGAWYDVGWWQRPLSWDGGPPVLPRAVSEIWDGRDEWQ